MCNGGSHLAPLMLRKLKYPQKLAVIKVPNRWFNSISILNSKTFEHWGSGSFLLFLDQVKWTTMIPKWIWDFFDQFGQNAALVIVRFRNVVDRTVKESIFLSWVSMKVQEKFYLMIFVDFSGQFFYQAYLRVQRWIRADVLTVEVLSRSRCPAVSNNDSVRIDHRDNNEPGDFSQLNSLLIFRTKPSDKTHNDVWTVWLTRMNPSCCKNHSFCWPVFLFIRLILIRSHVCCCALNSLLNNFGIRMCFTFMICNLQNWYVRTEQRTAQKLFLHIFIRQLFNIV